MRFRQYICVGRTLMVFVGVMLLFVQAHGGILYLCQMTGEVHSECCCAAQADDEGPQHPTAAPESCCVVLDAALDDLPALPSVQLSQDIAPAIAAAAARSQGRFPYLQAVPVAANQARAPPDGAAPPIYIRVCSYLI